MEILTILNIFGIFALFIFGIKLLNIGMQNTISKNNFRKKITRFVKNDCVAFLTGLFTTAFLQSSTAVSVLTISLADARFISFRRSAGVIIGANIGTTITAWLIVFFGLKYNILLLYLPLFLIGVPIYFFKRNLSRNWGLAIIGLAIIFLSISLLKENITHSFFIDWITVNDNTSIRNIILYLIGGFFITAFIQSSSVVTALAVITASQGDFSVMAASALILGANIGTTVTGQIAASVGNIFAKRVALFHTLFNVTGVILFLPFLNFISSYISDITPNEEFYIAAFHTLFNVITGIIFFLLLPKAVDLIKKKTPKKNISEELHYIDASMSVSTSIHIIKAYKEATKFASIIAKTIKTLDSLITESDEKKFENSVQEIIRLEKKSDQLEDTIREYLNQLIKNDLSPSGVYKIMQLSDIIHHLENVGDLALKLAYLQKERKLKNAYLKPELRKNIIEIQDLVNSATKLVIQNINEEDSENIQFKDAQKLEKQINLCYKTSLKEFYDRLEEGKINTISAIYYKEIIEIYEDIGNFLFKVTITLIR
ncbi:MAG: Na/Pi cotransporter family protein [Flavobacteriales bacterium]